jgi:hypothetical protein
MPHQNGEEMQTEIAPWLTEEARYSRRWREVMSVVMDSSFVSVV